jgi:hypothetical protein
MATKRPSVSITRRFDAEKDYIERYVRFLHGKSTIHDRQVRDLNRILKRVQIKPLPTRHYDRIGKPYSPEETKHLTDAIGKTEPEVYQTILGHEQGLDDIPSILLNGPAADHMHRLDEWVEYLVDRLSDDPEEEEIQNVIRNAMQEYGTVDQDLDEDERLSPEALRALLLHAVDHVFHVKMRQRVDDMVYAREQFEEIEVLARMAAPDAEINVLRQGFILLMTAFDAAVFDLVRVALRNNFFKHIGEFGKPDKVSLEWIGAFTSFEDFRDQVIEDQLKRRYVKDLLFLLNGMGVQCVDEEHGMKFPQLIEMVLRRNLHVHNRGVVDERYLERDAGGKPKFNLFGLSAGDIARVDEAYWNVAVSLCTHCVDRLARWADAGG